MSATPHDDSPTVTIRPRWIWGAVLLFAIGAGLLSAAVMTLLLPLAVAGGVTLLVAAAVGIRGNLYRDARTAHSPKAVTREIADDDSFEVVDPDARFIDPEVRRVAREAHETKVAALGAERGPVEIAPVGIVLLVVVALWLSLAQIFTPFTATGQDTGLWGIAVAIPLALGAFALRNGWGRFLAYVTVLACGVALVTLFLFGDYGLEWIRWSHLVSGVLVFVGAALAIGRNGIASLGK